MSLFLSKSLNAEGSDINQLQLSNNVVVVVVVDTVVVMIVRSHFEFSLF